MKIIKKYERIFQKYKKNEHMGPPEFESGFMAPKATRMGQATPRTRKESDNWNHDILYKTFIA